MSDGRWFKARYAIGNWPVFCLFCGAAFGATDPIPPLRALMDHVADKHAKVI